MNAIFAATQRANSEQKKVVCNVTGHGLKSNIRQSLQSLPRDPGHLAHTCQLLNKEQATYRPLANRPDLPGTFLEGLINCFWVD